MPRKKKKNKIVIGIDTLEVEIQASTLLHENTHIFRSANGVEIGRMKAVKNGYRLSICLGNLVAQADRATALALTKIMLMPDYEKEFSERYKTILSEKIRKPEQIEHEKAVEPILKEMGTKLGKLFMCNFHLKQAMKTYHN